MPNNTIRTELVNRTVAIIGAALIVACSTLTALPTSIGPEQARPGTLASPLVAPTVVELTPTAAPSATPSPTPIPIAQDISSNSFKLPLTTQHVTGTSAELYFELSRPADGMLIYQMAQEGTPEQTLSFDSSTMSHQITLEGLSPGVEYRAAVVLKDTDGQYHSPGFLGSDWGKVSFRTWSDRQPIRFGIIGDSGFGDAVTPRLGDQMAAAGLDFSIHVGDIVYNVFENADPFEAFALKYYQPLSPVLHHMPMYPVVGNHDEERATIWNGAPFYYHAFPAFADPGFQSSTTGSRNQWYAFAYGQVQFIMLDTQAFYDQKDRAAQKAWLAERLADKRFTTSIPAFHIAPYTGGAHVSDGLPVRTDWQPMFEQDGVRLVLSGHDHNYQRLVVNGITYIVSGGGSATVYQKTKSLPESQFFDTISHFVVFEVYPDRIELKSIALGGDVIDQASIALH